MDADTNKTPCVPISILTGYLGAGKTTLVNHLLSQDHGLRFAVIVNEFGEIGIDNDLILSRDEELLTMNNGCVCCTVRGDLTRTLRDLLKRSEAFDGIIIETTGLADPAPIIQTFFADQILMAQATLDSVTTVVDAVHVLDRIEDSHEAAQQIAFADQIILNKIEAVSDEARAKIEDELRRLNPAAPIYPATKAHVDLTHILGQDKFDLDRIARDFADPGQTSQTSQTSDDDHHHHNHIHKSGITSVSFASDKPMDLDRLGTWLQDLLKSEGQNILRGKGILCIAGDERKLVFQSVHMMMECDFQQDWGEDENRTNRIVFIGRNLNDNDLRRGFDACANA